MSAPKGGQLVCGEALKAVVACTKSALTLRPLPFRSCRFALRPLAPARKFRLVRSFLRSGGALLFRVRRGGRRRYSRACRPSSDSCSMRYFGVRTTAVATQGSGMAAAATELLRTASASVFTECLRMNL